MDQDGDRNGRGTRDARAVRAGHLLRDLLILAAGITASAILLWSGLATRPDPASLFRGSVSSLQELAGFAAAAAGLLIALWWSLGLVLAVLSAILQKAGHAAAAAAAGLLAPAFMKRLAAAAIGLNLVAGAGAAQAADSMPPANAGQSVSMLQHPLNAAVHPQWEPTQVSSDGSLGQDAAGSGKVAGTSAEPYSADNPATPQWKPRTQGSASNVFIRPGRSDAAGQAVVLAGDSLWSLAAEQLGPLATDAQIAAHWPRWYERNRDVIGDDPHLIIPGQIFQVPEIPEVPRH